MEIELEPMIPTGSQTCRSFSKVPVNPAFLFRVVPVLDYLRVGQIHPKRGRLRVEIALVDIALQTQHVVVRFQTVSTWNYFLLAFNLLG